MNAEIDELVMQAGASSKDERAGVGQLLLSAKRSFDKLEDSIGTAKQTLTKKQNGSSSGQQHRSSTVETSPLYLRLLPALTEAADKGARKIVVLPAGVTEDAVTTSLRSIEIALAATERTLRRVLTNGSLGLGSGRGHQARIWAERPAIEVWSGPG